MNRELLIVDDNVPFRIRLSKSMEKKGFVVTQAESVLKGIESVKIMKPGFAVVDLRLGDGNGLEVVKEIQKNNKSIGKKLFLATKNLVIIQSTNNSLSKCTICKKGDLIITSNSRNRALICSNSVNGSCVVKASLPRFGLIKIYKNQFFKLTNMLIKLFNDVSKYYIKI